MAYKSASWGLREDKDRALSLFRQAAELGFGPAMVGLAHELRYKNKRMGDDDESKCWGAKARDSGHSFALGFCYHFGHGVPRDVAAARLYYLEAAREGFPQAYSGLILVCDNQEERLQYLKQARV